MKIFIEEKSVFEHLSIADSERMHSEFLSWVFSENCFGISKINKKMLFENIFKIRNFGNIESIGTEINKTDIFIESLSSVIIVENKLKSSQHSNQLKRYSEYIKKCFEHKTHYFYFLTLIKEQDSDSEWRSISYEDILEELNKTELEKHKHSFYIEDYILYLKKLIFVLKEVLDKSSDYKSVFEDGKVKKIEKLNREYNNPIEKFIALNQLETILQKAYLRNFLSNEKIVELNGDLNETHGTALINFPLDFNIKIGGKRLYCTFIQLQGYDIKFAFAIQENYNKSDKKWIHKIIELFEEIEKENLYGFKKLNKPKTRAYISISKKMEIPYWELSLNRFMQRIQEEIRFGHIISRELIKKIETKINGNHNILK